jgi:Tfp pilus assembly protein PilN
MGDGVIQSQDIALRAERMWDGLARLLPPYLVRAGLPPRRVRSVLISALPLEPSAKAALALAGQGGAAVDLRLAPDLFLQRSVDLPLAARRDAASAVALQMRQSMPGQAEGLIWRHVPSQTDTGLVDVFVLKQARLTEVLQQAGVTLRRVTIDGVQASPLIDNRPTTDRPERFWNRAAPSLAAATLIAVLGTQAWTLSSLTTAISDETARVATLRDQAAAARATAEARSADSSARLADRALLGQESRRLQLIADLSRVLDNSVWISTLALDGATLRLTGHAQGEIAPVIAAIRPLVWVDSVDLDGAVSVDTPLDERRFQLIITLTPEATAP